MFGIEIDKINKLTIFLQRCWSCKSRARYVFRSVGQSVGHAEQFLHHCSCPFHYCRVSSLVSMNRGFLSVQITDSRLVVFQLQRCTPKGHPLIRYARLAKKAARLLDITFLSSLICALEKLYCTRFSRLNCWFHSLLTENLHLLPAVVQIPLENLDKIKSQLEKKGTSK